MFFGGSGLLLCAARSPPQEPSCGNVSFQWKAGVGVGGCLGALAVIGLGVRCFASDFNKQHLVLTAFLRFIGFLFVVWPVYVFAPYKTSRYINVKKFLLS